MRLLGDFHFAEEVHRGLLGLAFRHLADPDWREREIFEDGQVREQVEVLEHHADFRADLVDVLQVAGQFGAVNNDLALLMLFQPVDAADQGGFARA
jgi:hypothetical protein